MSSQFSIDSLTMMNNALNRELQRLGEDYVYDSAIKQRRNLSNLTSPSSHLHHTQSISTLSFNSVKNLPGERLKSPRNMFEQENISKVEATSKGLKMQKELISLHSKVLSLEKKVHLIDARTPTKKRKREVQTARKTSSHKKSVKKKFIEEKRSPKIQKDREINNQGMKSQYSAGKCVESFGGRSVSPLKNPILFDSCTRSDSQRKRPLETKRKIGAYSNEKTMKKKYHETSGSKKTFEQKTGSPSILKNSEFRMHSPVKGDSVISRIRDHENVLLNKKIMKLKKEYNEDKVSLKSERIKGEELAKEIEKLERKANKLQSNIDRFSKLGTEYKKLGSAFDKSEEIRRQQKNLIGNLNYELTLLKAEKENFALKRYF